MRGAAGGGGGPGFQSRCHCAQRGVRLSAAISWRGATFCDLEEPSSVQVARMRATCSELSDTYSGGGRGGLGVGEGAGATFLSNPEIPRTNLIPQLRLPYSLFAAYLLRLLRQSSPSPSSTSTSPAPVLDDFLILPRGDGALMRISLATDFGGCNGDSRDDSVFLLVLPCTLGVPIRKRSMLNSSPRSGLWQGC